VPIRGEERWALSLAALLFTLWSAQYFAYMTWLPQFLVEAHGLEPGLATLAYSVPVVTLIVVGLATSTWIRRGAAVGPLLAGSLGLELERPGVRCDHHARRDRRRVAGARARADGPAGAGLTYVPATERGGSRRNR
jgi:hypothetical protein